MFKIFKILLFCAVVFFGCGGEKSTMYYDRNAIPRGFVIHNIQKYDRYLVVWS